MEEERVELVDRDTTIIVGGAYIDLRYVIAVGQIRDELDYDSRKLRYRFEIVFTGQNFYVQFDTAEEASSAHEILTTALVDLQCE